ncbi:pyridoxal phosphate-dependent transferase [Kockovaella imperatae]|uniref:Pyridoxal phosphate-dependent transferase n=1 Tax=Kockovaella imperatae TaxID=4999 RepID=A0A1Y1UQY6_9TREE|nr:pyridoxal phosphate-dependent transferase [Kockovaella imperatae]ORX39894.1 pyridoxal phosphate-dependent transferase [Kockovaella imperatae]
MDSAFAIPGDLVSSGMSFSQNEPLPKAKDMTHHLNTISRNRTTSSLKQLYKYMTTPGMITLGGGIPSPEYFPFESISATVQAPDTLPLNPPRRPAKKSMLSWIFGPKTSSFTIPKYVQNADARTIQLATSLQYQQATGPPALPLFLREYVAKVYQPAYADWDVLINCGATDAWSKICFMLLEMGDAVLVEEWTYPGAENTMLPLETELVPIKMDGQGLLPDHLEQVLGGWNEEERGKRQPRVLYTVPTGQNPTGATMMGERKKQIYDICCKYDVIICEDEPYFCLYTGEWKPESQSRASAKHDETLEGPKGADAFIKALPPTYLRYDTEGRVIRMDTFSKTSCPGSRLGWFTSSPLFIERLTRATEASTQAPSGFVTAMTSTLVTKWGFDGYIRWLRGIKATYNMRKTWLCDAFEDVFHLEFDDSLDKNNVMVRDIFGGMSRGVTCYAKAPSSRTATIREKQVSALKTKTPLVSFIPPSAGMFVFLAVHFDEHPDYKSLRSQGENAVRVLSERLWIDLAENLVLFAPGWTFDANGPHAIGGDGYGYYRLSFSIATYEQMHEAVEKFAKVLTKFFKV